MMEISNEATSENKLSHLLSKFREQAPITILEIESLWATLVKKYDENVLKELRRILLRLADAGGTYGAVEVSFIARKLDLSFKSLQGKDNFAFQFNEKKEGFNELFIQLRSEIEEWLYSDRPAIKKHKSKNNKDRNLVYILLGDEIFASELIENIEKSSCEVKRFHDFKGIEAACVDKAPAVMIVDEEFTMNNISGIDVVAYLKNNYKLCQPIIYVSNSTKVEFRLEATRAGADRFFCKPVLMNKIIHTIKGLNALPDILPYRVLIIDDDIPLLECYEAILFESNMIVMSASEPLKAFSEIEGFKPDVIVIDISMPDCSGYELVHMIRQDDQYALIPVIFLSAEQDVDNQLEAMALGADDFLSKPVHANKLVATVNVTAKRARKNIKLNSDLKNALLENKYQLVTMDQHAIISTTDVTGKIIHVNDKLCEISGYSREELIGENHRLLKSDYHDELFYKVLWKTISSGDIWHGVICNLTKNGEEYWVESTIVPFINEKGKPYKYVSVRTDVTKLRVSERRLTRSQQFANIGSWDWDIVSGNLFWSEQIWPLFGYKKETTETTYENFINAIHPDDQKMVIDAVTNCVENSENYNIEHRVVWPDGSIHWLHESGDVVRNRDGTALHMLGVVQDITELKEAEIRQNGNNHILELIVRGQPIKEILQAIILHAEALLPDAICSVLLLDDSGKYFEYSEAPGLPDFYNEAMDGLEIGMGVGSCGEAAFSGKRVIVCDILSHPNWVPFKDLALQADLHACWSEPFSSSNEVILGTFAIYFSKPQNPDDNDMKLLVELAQFAAIAVEREQSQKKLLGAKDEAVHANQAKSQFLSSMSHELRTPMNAIMGFSQLLKINKSQVLTEAQEKNVNEIMVAGKHLMSLINEVLDLSKIESGNIELSNNDVVLSSVMNESLQLIIPLAQKRGIEVIIIVDDVKIDLDTLIKNEDVVFLDEIRLKQVVLNLLSNAVKYNNENGKLIFSYNKVNSDYFRISVTDTGDGLSETQQKQLFKAFNRLGLEQTEIEGTGIGLVITKKIIELMDGRIGMDSKVGVGSTFWLELPKKLNENAESLDGNIKIKEEVHKDNSMEQRNDKKSVLYIEDNPANLRLVEQVLQSLPNLKMWSAHEPLLGLELAEEHLPDLILLDINLPGMDGYEVLKSLRRNDKTCKIPVIAISANAMRKDIKKGEEAGFDSYITKPVNVKELLDTVESKLSSK